MCADREASEGEKRKIVFSLDLPAFSLMRRQGFRKKRFGTRKAYCRPAPQNFTIFLIIPLCPPQNRVGGASLPCPCSTQHPWRFPELLFPCLSLAWARDSPDETPKFS